MGKEINKWQLLSLKKKNELLNLYVRSGYTNLNEIKLHYNLFTDGGDINPGMTGMMKARMALSSEFGNSTARRMVNADGRDYTFTQEDSQHGGAPAGSKGNVYVASYDNLITPQIQDVDGNLKFIKEPWLKENAERSYNQSIKFDNPEDARYFGEHYKEIAPMMNRFNTGGIINSSTLKLNNLNTLYNIFDEGGNSAPKMLLRPVPQNINILLFKKDNTPIFPINHLITTPSNTKQVVTPKVESRNIPAFLPDKMSMKITPLVSESTAIPKQGDIILRLNPVINEVLEKNDKIISKNGFSFTRDNGVIEAKHGLVLPVMEDYAEGGSLLPNYDISQKSGIYESKWVENWLNSRKDILSQNEKVLDKFYDKYSGYPLRHLSDLSFSRDLKSDIEGQINNLKNTVVYSSYKDLYPTSALPKYKAISKDDSLSDNYMEALNNNENSAKVYSDSIYERFKTLGYRGFYSPNKEANTGGSIVNLVEYNTPEYYSTNIHEFSHSLEPEPQNAKIFDIIHGHSPFIRAQNNEDFYDENNKDKYNIDNYKKQIDLMLIDGKSHIYLDSPEEIYSRLMQFRHDNNLDPNKKYTNDDIELFRKNKNTKDNNFLNRYTNEYILKFINDVAFNNQNKNNNNLA